MRWMTFCLAMAILSGCAVFGKPPADPMVIPGDFCMLVTPDLLADLSVQAEDNARETRAKERLYGYRLCVCEGDCPRSA